VDYTSFNPEWEAGKESGSSRFPGEKYIIKPEKVQSKALAGRDKFRHGMFHIVIKDVDVKRV
jgi:hypothetical protein